MPGLKITGTGPGSHINTGRNRSHIRLAQSTMASTNVHERLRMVWPSQPPDEGLQVTQMEPNSTQLYLPLVPGITCLLERQR